MECLLPFSSTHISLPSSKLLPDIQTMLRLELHSAHSEHIFHALTDMSDTGATASRGTGGTQKEVGGKQISSLVILGQTEKYGAIDICLGGYSRLSVLLRYLGLYKFAAQAHSQLRHLHPLGDFCQELCCRRLSDLGLVKTSASTLTTRKSSLLLFFIIQILKNGLVVLPQSGSENVEPSTPGVGRCNTNCNQLEAHPP